MKLGVIGYGSIVRQALTALRDAPEPPFERVAILAKPGGEARAEALLESLGDELSARRTVVANIRDFLDASPDLVVEAAGHGAVLEHGATVLSSGVDLVVTSVGALADERLSAAIDAAGRAGNARCLICPGAIGGLDILAAARLAGITGLVYTSRKPPSAWRGTPAEQVVDLDGLAQAFCFFEGTAREAARRYPQNANVAATLALLGPGFDQTRVSLVADPGVVRNTHEISMKSNCVDMELAIAGLAAPDNPRTSLTTGFALAAQIIKLAGDHARRRGEAIRVLEAGKTQCADV